MSSLMEDIERSLIMGIGYGAGLPYRTQIDYVVTSEKGEYFNKDDKLTILLPDGSEYELRAKMTKEPKTD